MLLPRNPASGIGPCYKSRIHSHIQSFYFYSLIFAFALPTYFSGLFTSRSAGYRGTLHYSPNRCCILLFLCGKIKIAQNSIICAIRSLAYICILYVLGFAHVQVVMYPRVFRGKCI